MNTNSKIVGVRLNENKVITLASTFCKVTPTAKSIQYSRADYIKIEIMQPNVVDVYKKSSGLYA